MTTADQQTPDKTIDDGTPEPTARNWWQRSRVDVQERIDGFLEFCGILLAAVGGPRRVAMVVAVSLLAGGLGACLAPGPNSGAPAMAIGGAILGALLPLPRR